LSPVAPIGIGTSIVLITVGAIFKYAINAGELLGILDIQVTGTILLIIGILGLVLAVAFTTPTTSRPAAASATESPTGLAAGGTL
jgi:hypothetical protein